MPVTALALHRTVAGLYATEARDSWADSNHALIHQNLGRLHLEATGRQQAQSPALFTDHAVKMIPQDDVSPGKNTVQRLTGV
jgi:hypothetical protein